jgi:tripartite-type tricarboxylate transporter receptor subunit TctC
MRLLCRLVLGALVLAAPGFDSPRAQASEYPSRAVEIIVPWGAGGGADKAARKIAKLLEPRLGGVQVTNVLGAAGLKGLARLYAAPADGHTLSIITGEAFGSMASRTTEKRLEAIVPLAILVQQPSAILTSEGGRFKSWADVEHAAKTDTIRVAISALGSSDDLTVKYLNRAGLKFVAIPFAKPGERHSAILNGYADVLYEQVGDVRSFVENKQMKPVLFFSDKRDPRFKDTPAAVELGYNIRLPQFRAVVVRTETPAPIVKRLTDALVEASVDTEYTTYLQDQYADEMSFLAGDKALTFLLNELDLRKALIIDQNAMVGR